MNISEKIEEIRRQPEHIRLRYVWGCVAVSMLVILAVWIFSIVSMFEGEKNNPVREAGDNLADIRQKLQEFKVQAPSLDGPRDDQPAAIGSEGVATPADTSGFQYPAGGNSASATPQSDTYSDLSDNDSGQ